MGKPEVRQPSVVVASWKNQSWATTQPLGSGSVRDPSRLDKSRAVKDDIQIAQSEQQIPDIAESRAVRVASSLRCSRWDGRRPWALLWECLAAATGAPDGV